MTPDEVRERVRRAIAREAAAYAAHLAALRRTRLRPRGEDDRWPSEAGRVRALERRQRRRLVEKTAALRLGRGSARRGR